MKHRLSLPALAAIAALGFAASAANATVYIGLQQDAGAIVTVASDSSGVATFNGAFGKFETVTISLTGQPAEPLPGLIDGTVIAINSAGPGSAGELTVYLTSTGITNVSG